MSSDVPVALLIKNQYAVIPTAYSLEVLHLDSGKTAIWNFNELPFNRRIQTIAMRTNQAPGITSKAYTLCFGTGRGPGVCNMNLQ